MIAWKKKNNLRIEDIDDLSIEDIFIDNKNKNR